MDGFRITHLVCASVQAGLMILNSISGNWFGFCLGVFGFLWSAWWLTKGELA